MVLNHLTRDLRTSRITPGKEGPWVLFVLFHVPEALGLPHYVIPAMREQLEVYCLRRCLGK